MSATVVHMPLFSNGFSVFFCLDFVYTQGYGGFYRFIIACIIFFFFLHRGEIYERYISTCIYINIYIRLCRVTLSAIDSP